MDKVESNLRIVSRAKDPIKKLLETSEHNDPILGVLFVTDTDEAGNKESHWVVQTHDRSVIDEIDGFYIHSSGFNIYCFSWPRDWAIEQLNRKMIDYIDGRLVLE